MEEEVNGRRRSNDQEKLTVLDMTDADAAKMPASLIVLAKS
jgi:hypothetical protein